MIDRVEQNDLKIIMLIQNVAFDKTVSIGSMRLVYLPTFA